MGVETYQVELFSVLALLSVSYSISVRRIERLRRGLMSGRVNVLDVWTMAGALVLPPALVVALVLCVYVAEWPSRRIFDGGRPGRYAVSVGTVVLAALSASEVDRYLDGALLIVTAILVWTAINAGLIALVIWLFDDRSVLRMFLEVRAHVLDVSTKLVGVLLAFTASWHLGAATLIVPALLAGHWYVLRDTVRTTKAFDPETKLWSESGWRIKAGQAIEDASGCVVLMLIDPELAGQEARIVTCLAGIPRSTDPMGRYGTRQVALLSRVDIEPAGIILVRHVRDRLREAGISCQVGSSISIGEDLDALLMRAGSDLMKRRATAGVSARW
jgi:hypothetical protein